MATKARRHEEKLDAGFRRFRGGFCRRDNRIYCHEKAQEKWPQRERREIKNQRLKSKITEQNSKMTMELDFLIENCCYCEAFRQWMQTKQSPEQSLP